MPRIFLAGGGGTEDSALLDRRFVNVLPPGAAVLYLPIAARRDHDDCLDWFESVFRPLGIARIEMWSDVPADGGSRLDRFDAVYFGGGSTPKLLRWLRESGFERGVRAYLDQGGVVYGGSAGAIVLGRSIRTAFEIGDLDDEHLTDLTGLDLIQGYSIWCHYEKSHDARLLAYVGTRGEPLIALSERSGLQIDEGEITAVGPEPVIAPRAGAMVSFAPGSAVLL